MKEILKVDSLCKTFGPIKAVDNITLSIQKGQVVGILGPNGSGKTTTLSVILGIKKPDCGTFSWFGGLTGENANQRIGSLLEVPYFYPYLNLEKNLQITSLSRGKGEEDIPNALSLLGLQNRSKSAYYTLSLGMKQRLAIASTLIGDPEVLVLDEPTNGLDPEGIAEVRELIKIQAAKGKTILLASHILDEVEKVCSHLIILKNGKNIASGKVSELLAEKQVVLLESEDIGLLNVTISQNSHCTAIERTDSMLTVSLENGYSPAKLNAWLFEQGITLSRFEPKKRTLESQFLELVK